MASSIAEHPQRKKIIDAILSRQAYRDIEKWADPPVTRGSLSRFAVTLRHKTRDKVSAISEVIAQNANNDKELSPAVTRAVTEAAMLAVLDPIRERIAQHQRTIDRSLSTAEINEDGRTVASLISTDLKGLELDARLSGRLDNQQSGIVNNYYMLASNIQFDTPK